jgi:hypothetical protein
MHGWDGPIGVFRFKYRSRGQFSAVFMWIQVLTLKFLDDLQKKLIIPRTPSPEPPGPPSAAELSSEQKVRLARMRYDDLEMLRSLIAARKNHAGQTDSLLQRSFEGLTPEEIDLLALQKHAEMTVC